MFKKPLLFSTLLLTACSHTLTIQDFNPEDFKPTAKLSYQIEGKIVSQPTAVHNVLEGTDYQVLPKTEVILKGTANELWVAPVQKVVKTYSTTKGETLTIADFTIDQFIPLQTKAGNKAFALFVPYPQQVEIITAWGDRLLANHPEVEHGEGDYLVCSIDENGKPNMKDVWVVNGKIFPKTYDMSQMK